MTHKYCASTWEEGEDGFCRRAWGAESLTFREEVMESGLQSSALEASDLTKQKLSELGLSEEALRKLGFE